MSSYGVTESGFVKKTLEEIKDEIEAALRASLGDGINLLSDSVFGQLVGVFADRESSIWDVKQATYAAQYPQSASGQSLDNVCAITGVTRLQPVSTSVPTQLTGTPATLIPAGKILSNDIGIRFALVSDVTLAAAAAWAGSTAYAVDDIVTNNFNIYVCTVAGTSASSPGPFTVEDGITDGTVTWNFVGDGQGTVVGTFDAEDTGPIQCVTDSIATEYGNGAIETPVAGWDDARNLEDGDVGRDLETDPELRLRRTQLLASTGNATLDALIAKVLSVDDVTESIGFENTSDVTDGDGLPPHSFEIICRGGTNQDIFDAIWEAKPAGIESYGSVSGTAYDSIGNPHTVKFSRPTEVDIHVIVDVTVDPDLYPADGDAQIKEAIKAFGDLFEIGQDVIQSQIYASVFGVSGVLDVTKLWIDDTPTPTGTATIVIAKDELAVWDTGDIDVTST